MATLSKSVFKSEAELQEAVSRANLFSDDKNSIYLMRREVPIGKCVPDFVYVRFETWPVTGLFPDKWSYKHAFIVWLLRKHKHLDLRSIAERFFEPQSRIEPLVKDLVRRGAISKDECESFELSTDLRQADAEVMAVEVKIKNWKEALNQTKEYKRFADKAFVVMDSVYTPAEDSVLMEFRRNRIGLVALSGTAFEWIVPLLNGEKTQSPEREYLITSARERYKLWSSRNFRNDSSQLAT